MFEPWHRLLTLSSVKCVTISPFRNCEFRVDGARYVSSFCKQVFRLPICTGKTMVSTLHMGLISCRDWFCELLLCKFMYVLRMTRHSGMANVQKPINWYGRNSICACSAYACINFQTRVYASAILVTFFSCKFVPHSYIL